VSDSSGFDPFRPESYGDVTNEYVALRSSAALVEGRLELVWVTGPDAVSFLQGILSQDVAALAVGDVTRTLLLQPNGKLDAVATVVRDESGLGLLVEAGLGEGLATSLRRYLIRVQADLALETAVVSEVWGPDAGRQLTRAGIVEEPPTGWAPPVLAHPLHGLPRYVVVGDIEWPTDLVRAGRIATEAVRIEGGEPRNGVDLGASTIPQEAGLIDTTVSFTKGCYLGQELVARIDSRGHVNRHLRGVRCASNVIPPVGAEVFAGEKSVGALSSVAESLTFRAPVALALLRREVSPGDTVEMRWAEGSAIATVVELPFDDFTDL